MYTGPTTFHLTQQRKKIGKRLASEDHRMQTAIEHKLTVKCGCDLCLKLIAMHEETINKENGVDW